MFIQRYCERLENFYANIPRDDQCPFSSVRIPEISVQSYLERFQSFVLGENELKVDFRRLALVTAIYIDRIVAAKKIVVSAYSIHRIFAVGFQTAIKIYKDEHFQNSFIARVAGVQLREFNYLELRFLFAIGWDALVPREQFNEYVSKFNRLIPDEQIPNDDRQFSMENGERCNGFVAISSSVTESCTIL